MKSRFILLLFLVSSSIGIAQEQESLKPYFNTNEKGIAIGGYDPVEYIRNNKAVQGSAAYSAKIKDATFYFVSAKNCELFKTQSEKYIPAYGGWCAYAMGSYAGKVKVDPETFKVINGKVYLFYNFVFTNTLTDWNQDEVNLKSKADKNWNSFKHKK